MLVNPILLGVLGTIGVECFLIVVFGGVKIMKLLRSVEKSKEQE